jgi:MFS family permease
VVFNILVAIPCLYYSDRIWTRWGRRIPFIFVAFCVLAVTMVLIPLANIPFTVALTIIVWYIFWDVGATFETLIMEIIPPGQRGRAQAVNAWTFTATNMLSMLAITGRFDDVLSTSRLSLNGEQLIYWWGAGSLVFCIVFMALFIRETKPRTPPPKIENPILGPYKTLYAERRLWPAYLLVFSHMLMLVGLGMIDPLLWTEQWGYSKQDMGLNHFFGGLILLAVIPVIGAFADKVDRIKLFLIGSLGNLILAILYYCFVVFVLPDQRPSILQIMIFGVIKSTFGSIIGIVALPLLYEFIPRSEMGTAQGGINVVRTVTRIVTINGVGLWVTLYSGWFMPEGTYNYFSAYLFLILMEIIGLAFFFFFVRQVRRGKIERLGLTEFNPVEESGREK